MRQQPTNICPLLSIGRAADPAPCLEERCAWWHERIRGSTFPDRCALISIADALTEIDLDGVAVYND